MVIGGQIHLDGLKIIVMSILILSENKIMREVECKRQISFHNYFSCSGTDLEIQNVFLSDYASKNIEL